MSNFSAELTPYFQRVRNRLSCSKKYQNEQMQKIFRAAEEYAQENPNATLEEVEEYLGNPEEVAQELMESIDPEVLERDRKRKRLGVMVAIGILVAALIVVGIGFIHLTLDTNPIEITETLVIYPEEEIIP